MTRGHKPDYQTDRRKPRIKDGICSVFGCSRPSGIIYYIFPMCNRCFDYYADLKDDMAIKRLFRIRVKQAEVELDPVEEALFG